MPLRLLVVLAAIVAIASVVGCGSSGDDDTTVTETVTTSSATTSTDEVATTDETTADGETPAVDVQADGLTGFTSPTGNIGCYIDKRSVRCDIDKRDWDPPSRPARCPDQVDYGQGITMKAGGSPAFVCAGDTTLGGGDPLPYGQSIGAGMLRCESEETGMTCRDTETGRGFKLSTASYDLF
jgi:Family of unknown function (DUF6636)